MYRQHREFMEWTAAYDTGDTTMRSMARHRAWLERVSCPIVRLEGNLTPTQQLERVLAVADDLDHPERREEV